MRGTSEHAAELLRTHLRQASSIPSAERQKGSALSNYSRQNHLPIPGKRYADRRRTVEPCPGKQARVIRHLLSVFDPSYGSDEPIYNEEGEWLRTL